MNSKLIMDGRSMCRKSQMLNCLDPTSSSQTNWKANKENKERVDASVMIMDREVWQVIKGVR